MAKWPASPGRDRRKTRRSGLAALLFKGLAETFRDLCARVIIA
jgi:hypothetical protein